jgi:hypothetical protein
MWRHPRFLEAQFVLLERLGLVPWDSCQKTELRVAIDSVQDYF